MSEEKNIPDQNSEDRSQKIELNKESSAHFPEDSDAPKLKNMETHAHHLHKAPGKNWSHYVFEFFMLFLAVFCGFIAENQREHMVEHHREKQYAKMLLTDIQEDTTFINVMTTSNIDLMKGLDSLALALDTLTTYDNVHVSQVYRLFYTWGYTSYIVKFSGRTISQLRSAGGMRLIRKQNVSDAINIYYTGTGQCDEQAKVYFDDQNILINLSYRFFDKLYFLKTHEDMKLAMKMMTENFTLVREFINRVMDLKEVIGNYNQLLAQMKTIGINLDRVIKKEYDLKDEN